jgi:DNA-binding transcriptional MocR family regulator
VNQGYGSHRPNITFDAYGVSVKPDQVVVTSGTSPAMMLVFEELLEIGTKVIISDQDMPVIPIL